MLAVEGDQQVAVAVPCEGGVEAVQLPFGGVVAEVGTMHHLHEDMVTVGTDEVEAEVALRHVGKVDIHVGEVVALAGGGRMEGECGDGVGHSGQRGTVDDGLHIAVIV